MLLDDLRELKASLDRMRPWQAIAIACTVAGLFSYFGPRRNDDAEKASQLAALASLKVQAIESCNDTAKQNGDKVAFTAKEASFALSLDKQHDVPAVLVRQEGYVCFAPQGGDAQVDTDDLSE